MLGSAPDAEDAAQEAFVRAFSSIKRFQGKASFATWLHRIAVNVCLDELKRRRGRPQPLSSLISQNDDAGQEREDFLLGDSSASDPQVVLEQRIKQKEVQAALNALPELHRAVVVLCDMEGCSYEEAAAALNTNTGTIKSRLHRARQTLRQILAPSRELSSEKIGQKL
jgi:RNA polymerase sigma-70 factor (ECF subfamily)